MTRHLDQLARRVEDDPTFLACLLRLYAKSEGLAEEQLAGALGCEPDTLVLLRLCRAPTQEPGQFHKAVDEIATTFNIHPDRLADAIRRGQAIIQLGRPGGSTGTLAAARDGNSRRDNQERRGDDP